MKHASESGIATRGLTEFALELRNRHFLLLDLIAFCFTPLAALWLRTEGTGHSRHLLQSLALYALVAMAIRLLVFFHAGLYSRYWRYASIDELALIVAAVATATALTMLVYIAFLQHFGWILPDMPHSIPIIDGILVLLVVGSLRYSIRLLELTGQRMSGSARERTRVVVFGAGHAGSAVVQEIKSDSRLRMQPVAFLDIDPAKQGAVIHGVPVVGDRRRLPEVIRKYKVEQVIIAMPSAPGKTIRELLEICRQAAIPVKTIPGISEILDGRVTVNQFRPIEIGDLLRREPVVTDTRTVGLWLKGKRVLVTGAGGSIGRELCRQIALLHPAQLVLLGHGEHSIFQVANELALSNPSLSAPRVIADIRDLERLQVVFARFQPEVVFHAAAHKHVPLMEVNLEDAVTNNIAGTRNLVQVAATNGVEHLVAISTDKAVNPTSVMGVTKRVAELVVTQEANRRGRHYVCVRFGNVLGSRGSVVNVFQEQIARGGPVTVTCPEMERYFMTIPEAAHLVLQAATLGKGGEVFVLDMGQQVKLTDLARDLIELSGLQVGRDVDIIFTGIRPGEKLYEELFRESDHHAQTVYEKILISKNGAFNIPSGYTSSAFDDFLVELIRAAREGKPEREQELLKLLVPEYSNKDLRLFDSLRPHAGVIGPENCAMKSNGSRGCGKTCLGITSQDRLLQGGQIEARNTEGETVWGRTRVQHLIP